MVGRARRVVDGSPAAPLAVVTVGAWILWAALDGGFQPTRWGPLGMAILLLAALTAAFRPPAVRGLNRAAIACFACLGGLVAWSFLSMLWADLPSEAWGASDKTLLYGASFAVFALWPWTTRARRALVALFALGVGLVAIATLTRFGLDRAPVESFQEGRLTGPTGYVNATVALWMLGLWPALSFASRRSVHPALRGAALAVGTLELGLAVLGQSRGWLVVLPAACVIWLLLNRDRRRVAAALSVVIAAVLGILPELLEVYRESGRVFPPEPTVEAAALVLVVAPVSAGLAWAAWAWFERHSSRPRGFRVAAAAACVVVLAATGARAGVVLGHPGEWLGGRFADTALEDGETGFRSSLDSDRYQKWEIAWHAFLDRPFLGLGADNYAARYLLERSNPFQEPLYPHSIPLRLLSNLGAVGTALFAVFAAAAVALALRNRRETNGELGGDIAAAVMVFVYWLAHGSIDAFWEVPALAAPAFGMLGLAAARSVAGAGTTAAVAPKRDIRLGRIAAALVVAVACAALLLPWLSYAFERAGARAWRQDAATAFDRLDTAAQLEPLDPKPLMLAGAIALRTNDLERAASAFSGAFRRAPASWYPNLQLGLLAAWQGDYSTADHRLARALELNPRDPLVQVAATLIGRGERLSPRFVGYLFELGANRLGYETLVRRYFATRL